MNLRKILPEASRAGKSGLHRGFAIVSAIFLLVVLAGLGVALVTFSTSQHASSALDVMGSRAYQAARAGVEWALYQRLNPQVGAPTVHPAYCSAASTAGTSVTNSFALPAGTSLSPFTVTVQCTATSNVNVPVVVRTIKAWACNQPDGGSCPGKPAKSGTPSTNPPAPIADYVQRTVQVSVQELF